MATGTASAIVVRLAITLPAPKAFGDNCFDLRLLRAEDEDAVVRHQHIGRLDLGKGEVERLHRCEQRSTAAAHGVYKHVPWPGMLDLWLGTTMEGVEHVVLLLAAAYRVFAADARIHVG